MLVVLLVAQLVGATPPVEAPIVPNAIPLEEEGRYISARSFDETIKYYSRLFRSIGGVRWRHIINLPGIKAKHLQCLYRRSRWEGINIYEHGDEVRFYVIPRSQPQQRTRKSKGRWR